MFEILINLLERERSNARIRSTLSVKKLLCPQYHRRSNRQTNPRFPKELDVSLFRARFIDYPAFFEFLSQVRPLFLKGSTAISRLDIRDRTNLTISVKKKKNFDNLSVNN